MGGALVSAAFTPGPWTNEPGLFFICNVGNNLDDPGVWSTAIPTDGVPFPFGSKEADARLIAAAPELYDSIDVPNLRKVAEFLKGTGSTLYAGLITMMADKQERALAKARGDQ